MALHPDSLPLCFPSVDMYDGFLVVITQISIMLLYIERGTAFKVAN